MMRFWFESYVVRVTLVGAAIVSVIVHGALITFWVVSTLPTAGLDNASIANHVFYIPPPDRAPTHPGSRETLRYIDLTTQFGIGTGDGPQTFGDGRPTPASVTAGDQKDSVMSAPLPAANGPDSVYSVLEVDSAVVRSAKSAAPAYPLKLLEAHIMGYVNARYIVDTTGFADTASFHVMTATNPEFIDAVKEALPYMRFQPAKIGAMKVRQLVEQQFSFRITDGDSAATPPLPKRKP
jgi:hypothetical protein